MLWFREKIKKLEKEVKGTSGTASGIGTLILATIEAAEDFTAYELQVTYLGIETGTGQCSRFIYTYLLKHWNAILTLEDTQSIAGGNTGTFSGAVATPQIGGTNIELQVTCTELTYWTAVYRLTKVLSIAP